MVADLAGRLRRARPRPATWPGRSTPELRPFNLGRLNPLGLNLAAPALFAHGTEEQRLRFLPPIVRNEEVWCQLFSEPGAGSDLASLATRAERDGDEWVHHRPEGVDHVGPPGRLRRSLLARTDPDVPKRKGITYFLLDLHQPGVDVRPLRHISGEVDFNEVFLDGARVPDAQRVGRGRRRAGGWPTPRCRASARWCRAPGRAASTASAARASRHLLEPGPRSAAAAPAAGTTRCARS